MMYTCVCIGSEPQLAQDMLNPQSLGELFPGLSPIGFTPLPSYKGWNCFSFQKEQRHRLHNPANRDLPKTIKHHQIYDKLAPTGNNRNPAAKKTWEWFVFLPVQPLQPPSTWQQHVYVCLKYTCVLQSSSKDTFCWAGREPDPELSAARRTGTRPQSHTPAPQPPQNQHRTWLPSPAMSEEREGGVCVCTYKICIKKSNILYTYIHTHINRRFCSARVPFSGFFFLQMLIEERIWVLPPHQQQVAVAGFLHQVSKALWKKSGISFSLFQLGKCEP